MTYQSVVSTVPSTGFASWFGTAFDLGPFEDRDESLLEEEIENRIAFENEKPLEWGDYAFDADRSGLAFN